MKFKKKYIVIAAVLIAALLMIAAYIKTDSGPSDSTDIPEAASSQSGSTDIQEGASSQPDDTDTPVASSSQEENQVTEVDDQNVGIHFPYELEEGKLLVNSLFQSSIINPDCGNESGEDIATLEVINTSDEFLQEAQVSVKLADGREIPFVITNIPAGKKVWAFATDNAGIELGAVCKNIACNSEFLDEMPVMPEILSYEVEETTVTLNNLTAENLTDLSIGCHCLFDDVYFGGLTYSYKVDELSANSSTTIDADECYLGSAEVVCITEN